MTDVALRTVFQRRPYTSAIADKAVTVPGAEINFVEVDLIAKAMPDICDLQYDVGEITLLDYIVCRTLGKPLVGLPVFVTHNFLHGRIWYHTRSGIRSPKDLKGKRVGVKSYTQAAPVWNRGILASEYGVDLGKITWVTIEDSHVREYKAPANVVPAPKGRSLAQLLEDGDIDAADDPARPWTDRGEEWPHDETLIKPLLTNGKALAAEWHKRTGAYPILHMIVVKADVLDRQPSLGAGLFGAFVRARDAWLDTIPDRANYKDRGADIVGPDFLPYGVAPNRATLEMACKFAYDQGIAPRPVAVEDLFGPGMMALDDKQ